jgi:hypothetical protein
MSAAMAQSQSEASAREVIQSTPQDGIERAILHSLALLKSPDRLQAAIHRGSNGKRKKNSHRKPMAVRDAAVRRRGTRVPRLPVVSSY